MWSMGSSSRSNQARLPPASTLLAAPAAGQAVHQEQAEAALRLEPGRAGRLRSDRGRRPPPGPSRTKTRSRTWIVSCSPAPPCWMASATSSLRSSASRWRTELGKVCPPPRGWIAEPGRLARVPPGYPERDSLRFHCPHEATVSRRRGRRASAYRPVLPEMESSNSPPSTAGPNPKTSAEPRPGQQPPAALP